MCQGSENVDHSNTDFFFLFSLSDIFFIRKRITKYNFKHLSSQSLNALMQYRVHTYTHTHTHKGWSLAARWLNSMSGESIILLFFGQLFLSAVSGLQQIQDGVVLRTVPSPVMSLAGPAAGARICSSPACSVLSAWVVPLCVCQYTRTVSCVLDTHKAQIWGPLPSPAICLQNINNRKRIMWPPKNRLDFICLQSPQTHIVVFCGNQICTNGD